MDDQIIFDWFSATLPTSFEDQFTSPYCSKDGFGLIAVLGGQDAPWEAKDTNARGGYQGGVYLDGLNIHFPGDKQEHPNFFLEMSGKGCRSFETYCSGDWNSLFSFASENMHITRLDVAFDDHSGLLDMQTLFYDTFFKREYVSKANKHELQSSWDDRSPDSAFTIYHGSPASEICIRIYDKAKQLGYDKEHWIRVEMQLRGDRASSFISEYLKCNDLGTLFCSVLLNYLRYVDPCDTDSNRWRWPLKDYWSALVDGAYPLKLSKPGVEYNVFNLENFVINQAGNSIRTFIELYGVDRFLERLKETRPAVLPVKYKEILRTFKL